MGLFGRRSQVVALIDIGSSSIGGAYASIDAKGACRLHYAARVPIEIHERNLVGLDMLNALNALGQKLIHEGAPQLRKAVGSGTVDRVFASIGSPWQDTRIRSVVVEQAAPFVFTKQLLHESVAAEYEIPKGRIASGELVVATLLNGYETRDPFGKKATRAEMMVLSSTIEEEMAGAIVDVLARLYHTRDITLSAFAPVAYTVLRDLYPHEKDFLVIHVSGEATDLALVKRGILVEVASVSSGLNNLTRAARKGVPLSMTAEGKPIPHAPATDATITSKKEWIGSLATALREFSERRALSRTVFLLADEGAREHLCKILDDESLHSLWLSDEPLTIIPSIPQHLSSYVTCDEGCEKDLFLSILALSIGKNLGIENA